MKTTTTLIEPPVRLCCMQRHNGPMCPDGKVMCCLCFERVDQDHLHKLPDGSLEDACETCAAKEQEIGIRMGRKAITAILCASLIALPIHAQEKEPDVHASFAIQCGVALVIVAVVGTGCYVIYKCNKNSQHKCSVCGEAYPEDANYCPNCGNPVKCPVCDTDLGEGDKCPKCGEKKPDPVPPNKQNNSVQMSSNGSDWQTVVPAGPSILTSVQIQRFSSETEFYEYLGSHPEVIEVHQMQAARASSFFRLANQ